MTAPRLSLLHRLQQGDQAAWQRLVDLYSAHLFLWGCRAGLQGPEAADLVRGVFDAIRQKLPAIPGNFRDWLRSLAHGQQRKLLQRRPETSGQPAQIPATADSLWEGEYLPALLGVAIQVLQGDFPASQWQAFWAVTVEGKSAVDVARELNSPPASVPIAEAHVLRQLRQELAGLLD
jgi:DNA-directed RNA polymerase specialized sigma24 family protein